MKIQSMMKKWMRSLAVGVVAATAVFGLGARAEADTIHLKDGKVIEGTITREDTDWLEVKYTVAGIEKSEIVLRARVSKIEKDGKGPAATPAANPGEAKAKSKDKTGPTRIAVLNFGPPSDWSDSCGDMVGVQISSAAFRNAIEKLEKEAVDIVVIRINSGGGYSLEMDRFQDLFHNEYKPKFRTVGWVESAISAAAMSPYVLEEFYFMTKGSFGGCTEWSGALVASKGWRLEMVLAKMEEASKKAGRDPKIMRSMQIQEPLSASIDPVTGKVTWHQDATSGKIINPVGKVLTMNSEDAVDFKFARAIADTREELAVAMLGPNAEYEFVGQKISDYVDNFMREQDKAEKKAVEVAVNYVMNIRLAQGAQDREERGQYVGIARRFLDQLERWTKMNPNMEFHLGNSVGAVLDREWFTVQRELLKDLMR